MMITTRLAHADDVTAILRLFRELDELHAEALPAYFQVPDPSQLTPEEIVQASTDPQQYLLLAIDHERIVGIVFARLEEEPAAPTSIFRPRRLCWVRKLIITHPYRQRGVGHQLMEHVEQWAQQQGVSDIELLVWAFNQPALAFYEELGYVPRNFMLGKRLSPATC